MISFEEESDEDRQYKIMKNLCDKHELDYPESLRRWLTLKERWDET